MAPFDRSHATASSYWLSTVIMVHYCIVSEVFNIE